VPTWDRNPYCRGLWAILPVAACAVGAASARAGQVCPVEVSGDPGGAWERAARGVAVKLAEAHADHVHPRAVRLELYLVALERLRVNRLAVVVVGASREGV
jgi:hypothetical protein